ncbi:MAG TPA: hypothetical protein VF263_23765 [Longimicrobiaceae bacterium]
MSRFTARLRRGVFGLSVLGALSFGATQALASPQPRADAAPTCDQVCNRVCQSLGLIGGFCSGEIGCSCYI